MARQPPISKSISLDKTEGTELDSDILRNPMKSPQEGATPLPKACVHLGNNSGGPRARKVGIFDIPFHGRSLN
ncbi:MAG: hypothetical protein EB090_01625 [Verrucomicrobia bacterium]|nr:hypothetical protein [Verrucomicrobiota bacterium]